MGGRKFFFCFFLGSKKKRRNGATPLAEREKKEGGKKYLGGKIIVLCYLPYLTLLSSQPYQLTADDAPRPINLLKYLNRCPTPLHCSKVSALDAKLYHTSTCASIHWNKEVKEGSSCQSPPLSSSYHFRLLTGCQSSCQILILHSLPLVGVTARFGWITIFFFAIQIVQFHSTLALPPIFRSHTH